MSVFGGGYMTPTSDAWGLPDKLVVIGEPLAWRKW